MATMIAPDSAGLSEAGRRLREGNLVAFPTGEYRGSPARWDGLCTVWGRSQRGVCTRDCLRPRGQRSPGVCCVEDF